MGVPMAGFEYRHRDVPFRDFLATNVGEGLLPRGVRDNDGACAALDRCMEIVAEEARDGWRLVQVVPMLSERVAYMQGNDRTWGYRVVLERPVGEE